MSHCRNKLGWLRKKNCLLASLRRHATAAQRPVSGISQALADRWLLLPSAVWKSVLLPLNPTRLSRHGLRNEQVLHCYEDPVYPTYGLTVTGLARSHFVLAIQHSTGDKGASQTKRKTLTGGAGVDPRNLAQGDVAVRLGDCQGNTWTLVSEKLSCASVCSSTETGPGVHPVPSPTCPGAKRPRRGAAGVTMLCLEPRAETCGSAEGRPPSLTPVWPATSLPSSQPLYFATFLAIHSDIFMDFFVRPEHSASSRRSFRE
jgi:hypothetical protein